MTGEDDAEFIFSHAVRIVKVAMVCSVSAGTAEAARIVMRDNQGGSEDWIQSLAAVHDSAALMTALRVALLLDQDSKVVSFQTVYQRLRNPNVQEALLGQLAEQFGPDDGLFGPPRRVQIAEFLAVYRTINWDVHSRLVHLRNLGIAHLTAQTISRSITFDELSNLVSIIVRLALIIQRLCQTATALHDDAHEYYRTLVRDTLLFGRGSSET